MPVTGTAQIEAKLIAEHKGAAAAKPAATTGFITKGVTPATGALSTDQAAWLEKMTPYAAQAAAATGLTEQLILAQWANETAWGTSYAFLTNNNVAGIGITTAHATGLVSPTLEAGVQAYINEFNTNPDFEKIKTAGKGLTPTRKTQAQAAALAKSTWAAGHYTGGAGLPLSLVTKSITNVGETPRIAAAQQAVTTATKNLQAAQKSGTIAAVATAQSTLATAKSTLTSTVATVSAKNATAAAAGPTAAANIDAVLRSAGLTALIGWANGVATTLTAKGLSPSGVATEVITRMQTTPKAAPVFNEKFPGFTQRVKNGYPAMSLTQYLTYRDKAKADAAEVGLSLTDAEIGSLVAGNVPVTELSTGRGVNLVNVLKSTSALRHTFTMAFPGFVQRIDNGFPAMSLTQYRTYETKAKAMGMAAGLPAGFMGPQEIGALVSHNVSTAELSTRLTNAYAAAMNVPQETKNLLQQYYGINTGHLAAYWLTPDKATNVFKQTITHVKQEITSAQIGATAKAAGFTLGKPESEQAVQRKVATGRPGHAQVTPLYLAQVGVSQATARDTFKALATLLPLTEALPGVHGEKTSLGENTLVNFGFYGTNAAELANVEQARTAPFRGGGGYVQTAKGVVGAGYGSAQGVQSE